MTGERQSEEVAVRAKYGKSGMQQPRKPPYAVLRDLVDRSGLSYADIARQLDYASTSGFSSFLNPKMGDKPIPFKLIQKLIPLLQGRGTPPITSDELLGVSEVRSLRPPASPLEAQGIRAVPNELRIRYRVEPGVFMDTGMLSRKVYGPSGLVAINEYPAQNQFAVLVADDPKTTTLLCVEPDKVPILMRRGRRCVTMVEREKTGLAEIVLAECDEDGRVHGTILGVVVGVFTRE
jgi:hypothetical protein